MNKYEQIVAKLLKHKNTQQWENIPRRKVPDVLSKYGQIDKVYKTKLSDDLTLYLYTTLRNCFDTECEDYYIKEFIGASIFCESTEVRSFDDDNVDKATLYELLRVATENSLEISTKLNAFLEN
ncbi:MAG: hypothetical protein J6C85_04705 [Alphaproteobacteria bacterium]|nr:hypothetical protein [Alphaproteobacteria bacterium]